MCKIYLEFHFIAIFANSIWSEKVNDKMQHVLTSTFSFGLNKINRATTNTLEINEQNNMIIFAYFYLFCQ